MAGKEEIFCQFKKSVYFCILFRAEKIVKNLI